MDIYLIWAQESGGEYRWLVGAWDDDSIGENREGYELDLTQARAEHGAQNIRVVKAHIDFDKVTAAFDVPSVGTLTVQED